MIVDCFLQHWVQKLEQKINVTSPTHSIIFRVLDLLFSFQLISLSSESFKLIVFFIFISFQYINTHLIHYRSTWVKSLRYPRSLCVFGLQRRISRESYHDEWIVYFLHERSRVHFLVCLPSLLQPSRLICDFYSSSKTFLSYAMKH